MTVEKIEDLEGGRLDITIATEHSSGLWWWRKSWTERVTYRGSSTVWHNRATGRRANSYWERRISEIAWLHEEQKMDVV
jgi:hypothetical protein